MKKLSWLLALLVLLFCGLAFAQSNDYGHDKAPAERITHGPVVESTGATWAVVAWSTDTGGSSIVRYGTDPNHLSERAEAPYADSHKSVGQTHRVKIDHLTPGTKYFFIVDSGQGEGTGTEARSRVDEFTTKR
jgi:hypothetical protein